MHTDTRPNDTLVGESTTPARKSRGGLRWGRLTVVGWGALLTTYLSIIVFLPIAAVVGHGLGFAVSTHGTWVVWQWEWHANLNTFVTAVLAPGAWRAIRLSVLLSLAVAATNSVMGLIVAWVLVRRRFRGAFLLEAVIDIPFALPTIVAGVVFVYLYGPASPLHVSLFGTWVGLLVALLFVTLPFSVRSVQPVLASLNQEPEHAARTLGASSVRQFATVIFPSIAPAVLGGFGLAFARAVGEFGSISLIGGGLPRATTASTYLFDLTQGFLWTDAAAVSTVLLALSIVVLGTCAWFSSRVQARLGQ